MNWNYFGAERESPYELISLYTIRIYNNLSIVSFPKVGLYAPNLRELSLNTSENLKSLPERMHELLPSLEYMLISNCPELESFPEGGFPYSLNRLAILGCEKLVANRSEWNLQRLTSLNCFEMSNQRNTMKSLLEEAQMPITLTTLEINNCLNLTSLANNGSSVLPALQELRVLDCPKLQSLPEEGLPESLSFLQIRNSPLLAERDTSCITAKVGQQLLTFPAYGLMKDNNIIS